jgi:hypothetical protein
MYISKQEIFYEFIWCLLFHNVIASPCGKLDKVNKSLLNILTHMWIINWFHNLFFINEKLNGIHFQRTLTHDYDSREMKNLFLFMFLGENTL